MAKLIFNNETTSKALSIFTKTCVWLLLFAIIYILRSFSLLIFLTFVFSYIQAKTVERFKHRINSRVTRVLLVSILFWGLLVSVFAYVTPQFIKQGHEFIKNLPLYVSNLDKHIMNAWENNTILQDIIPNPEHKQLSPVTDKTDIANMNEHTDEGCIDTDQIEQVLPFSMKNSPTINLINSAFGNGQETGSYLIGGNIKKVASAVRFISVTAFSLVGTFMLSLLFAFLIIMDLPRLKRMISDLRNTKLQFIYNEVSESIKNFCDIMGKALEAQFFIAICNTILTFAGLFLLGLQAKGAFLSVIVFVCSFIPIVGVFVSSIPIFLFALQNDGFSGVLLAATLIAVIHSIEAYILNPRIYGSHLKLNPVIVLIILTVCGKLFHVWGLVLGVPVFSYFFYYVIRHKGDHKS